MPVMDSFTGCKKCCRIITPYILAKYFSCKWKGRYRDRTISSTARKEIKTAGGGWHTKALEQK